MDLVRGTCDPAFQNLRGVLSETLDHGGGAVAVVQDGRLVAHLWGGHADAARTRPWTEDTLVNVWSVTKGVMAIAVAMMVERGRLDYGAPIAEVWPEFAANGKGAITLGQAMAHVSGLNGLSVPMDEEGLLAWTPYVDAIAAMAPLTPPGSQCAYHALTYGHIAGEVLRRASGMGVGQFLQTEISGPLAVPFYVGLPAPLDHLAAEMIEGANASKWVRDVLASPRPESCANPTPRATAPNDRAWRAAEVPGGNGHGTAVALATIFGAAVRSEKPLITPHTLSRMTAVRFQGVDVSFNVPTVWGAGVHVGGAEYDVRASRHSFGHGGWGGSLVFADPDARLGFAYVTNHMLGFDDGVDPRRARLIAATYDSL